MLFSEIRELLQNDDDLDTGLNHTNTNIHPFILAGDCRRV